MTEAANQHLIATTNSIVENQNGGRRCQRNHERRHYLSSNRADKLTKSTG